MKKLLIIPILILASLISKAQAISASDSLAYTATKDTLIVASGYTNPVWKIASGPGVIANSAITGLKAGATTVLLLQTTNNNTTSISYKVITVAAVPPPKPRSVIGFNLVLVSGVLTAKYTFDDGSTQ